jgi:hypothetical protein
MPRLAAPLALTLAALGAAPAGATRSPAVAYDLSVAGVPVGEATLTVAVEGARYVVEGAADVGFLFWGGRGGARSEGTVEDGRLRPDRYRLSYQGVRRPGATEIDFADGRAVRWAAEPPPPEDYLRDRTPVEDRHLSDVLDPLAALVAPLPADASPAAVCAGVASVFSGWTRFDIELAGGTAAPDGAVVCRTRYRAVAGHRPDSAGVARLETPGAVALTLAPVGPSAWAPQRLSLPTRFGPFEMVRRAAGAAPAPRGPAPAARAATP